MDGHTCKNARTEQREGQNSDVDFIEVTIFTVDITLSQLKNKVL